METTPTETKEDHFKCKLDFFEGPLDLLLYLIKKNEIDLNNLRLEPIVSQYLEYIEMMRKMNVDIASEFIVTAATLLHLKTKWLLPIDLSKDAEEDSFLEDEKLDLLHKLLEYKKFKEASEYLDKLHEKENFSFPRGLDEVKDFKTKDKNISNANVFDLYKTFQKIISNKIKTINEEVVADTFTIEGKISDITKLLHDNNGEILFSDIIKHATAKDEIVCSFIGILELIKLQKISVSQSKQPFGDILVKSKM